MVDADLIKIFRIIFEFFTVDDLSVDKAGKN